MCIYIYIYIYIRAVNRLKYLIAWLSRVNLWLIAINRTFLFVLNVPSINTFQVFNTPINICMDKYDALCICMFIIIKTIVNSIKTRHVSKVIDVFQRTCSLLLDTWKNKYKFPLLLFLCIEQFTYTNLFKFFAGQGSSLLLNMQNVHSLYCLLLHLFASLCPHTVFWCN